MRARAYWPVTVAAALLVGLLAYGLTTTGADTTLDSATAKGERVDPPTAASLPVLGGSGSGSLADYRGKVVLVNVWASWCAPCRDELPLIQKAHKMLSARGGTVVGIDVKENSGAALEAVDEFGLTFPNLRDRDGSFVREWGQTGYPENYVIDREGRVAAVRRFPVTQKWLDETLPPLLEESA
ncbi:MAG TPA: TlpA disulfide reductase family protein [Solirubrobacteraceae bacterium]|nr:TlpA disulfide reductase family protein [Solirubrobacteraceae bacterium]